MRTTLCIDGAHRQCDGTVFVVPENRRRPCSCSCHQQAKRTSIPPARQACITAVIRRDGRRCWAKTLVPDVRCTGGLDGHELFPRGRGGDANDPDNVRMICRGHHRWVHAHPASATEVGLLIETAAPDG